MSSCRKDETPVLDIDPCGIDFNTSLHYTAIGDDYADGTIAAIDSTVGLFIKESLLSSGHELTDFNEFYVLGAEGRAVELIQEIDAQSPTCVNVMTVMIGTNDVLANTDSEIFRLGYRAILERCITIAGSGNLVTGTLLPNFSILPGLPVEAGTPEEVANRIVMYNTIIEEETEALGVNLADIGPITNSFYGGDLGYEKVEDGGDDFHPDLLAIKLWANTMTLYVSQGLD
jgi:lysophospholipase L1-like esterase